MGSFITLGYIKLPFVIKKHLKQTHKHRTLYFITFTCNKMLFSIRKLSFLMVHFSKLFEIKEKIIVNINLLLFLCSILLKLYNM